MGTKRVVEPAMTPAATASNCIDFALDVIASCPRLPRPIRARPPRTNKISPKISLYRRCTLVIVKASEMGIGELTLSWVNDLTPDRKKASRRERQRNWLPQTI